MAKQLQRDQISSYAYKNSPTGQNKDLEFHYHRRTALLVEPGHFLEHTGSYAATVDMPAKDLNEKVSRNPDRPISGDDLAKMGNKRISMAPTLRQWVDVPQDRAHYENRKFSIADQQAESSNPSKGM